MEDITVDEIRSPEFRESETFIQNDYTEPLEIDNHELINQQTAPAQLFEMPADAEEEMVCEKAFRDIEQDNDQLSSYNIDSKSKFHRLALESMLELNNIRSETANFEEGQRLKEHEKAKKRLDSIHEDLIIFKQRHLQLTKQWDGLLQRFSAELPTEIMESIACQKQICDELTKRKEELIINFENDIKEKDGYYVQAMQHYGEEVDKLLLQIKTEIKNLLKHYEEEIDKSEEHFSKERENYLQKNREEIDELLQKKKEKEVLYLKYKQEQQLAQENEIQELFVQGGGEYHQLKLQLEIKIASQEGQLQESKARHQYDQEKLLQDNRLISNRVIDQASTIKLQKKKLSKLKDILDSILIKFKDHDGREKKRFEELSHECQRIRRQSQDLQHRFRHFEFADKARYGKTRSSHQEQLHASLEKLVEVDEIIFKELLHVSWDPSSSGITGETALGPASLAQQQDIDVTELENMLDLLIDETGSILLPWTFGNNESESKTNGKGEIEPEAAVEIEGQAVAPAEEEEEEEEEDEDEGEVIAQEEEEEESKEGKKKKEEKEEVDQISLQENEKQQDKRQAILYALGIHRKEDLYLLYSCFQKGGGGDAFDILAQFFQDHRQQKMSDNGSGSKEEEKQQQMDLISWKNLCSEALPEDHWVTWQQLEKALVQYHRLLEERGQCLERIMVLHRDNRQLKERIDHCMTGQTTHALLVPPFPV